MIGFSLKVSELKQQLSRKIIREARRLEDDVTEIAGKSHIRLTGNGYVGEIVLDGNTVTYSLAETSTTLDALTGN